MTNDEIATKLSETLMMLAQAQAQRNGQKDKTEFNQHELLVAVVGAANGMINLTAYLAAQIAGAADGGLSLQPAYYRYVGTAMFNAARDAEVSMHSLAHQRVQAGGSHEQPN